jgi:hypothetical protein
MRSVPRLYNEEQLRSRVSFEMAVRRVGVSCETVVGEEATALEAVTRRKPVKIQQTEKTLYVL